MGKGKKSTISEPHPGAVSFRDLLQRLNYLHQAAVLLTQSHRPPTGKRIGWNKEEEMCELIPTQSTTTAGLEEKKGEGVAGPSSIAEAPDGVKPTTPLRSSATAQVVASGSLQKDEGKETKMPEVRKKSKRATRRMPDPNIQARIARNLVKTMREVAKKGTVRMDPSVKRTLCKSCNAVLIPGLSARVRVRPSGPHGNVIVSTCSNCSNHLRLPAPPHKNQPPDPSLSSEPPEHPDVSEHGPRKRAKKDLRVARRPTFFEREGHVTFVGNDVVRTT